MSLLTTFDETDKNAFFQKYTVCAEETTLEAIWEAKTTNATELSIYRRNVSDLSPLKDLRHLQELDVSTTQVSDLSPLKDLVHLRVLDLACTQVHDLSPLKELFHLEQLNIEGTQVTDLSPLKDLHHLQSLLVGSTQVSDLSPLKDLHHLNALDLSFTQVCDLSPLKTIIEKGIVVQWAKLNWESLAIDIGNTPLSNPPIAIAKQGNAAILSHWEEKL